MLDKSIVNLFGLVFFFMVVEMFFEDDIFSFVHMSEFFLMVVLSLVVYNFIIFDPVYYMKHNFLLHIAFFTQALDILQLFLQFLHPFLCIVLLIHILILLYLILLTFCLEILDLFLLLLSYFVHVIVFLPDVEKDVMGCNFSIVVYSLRFLP